MDNKANAGMLWVLKIPVEAINDALQLSKVPWLSTHHLWMPICPSGGLGP